jgi:single-stranded-DNA-specific exonuclease
LTKDFEAFAEGGVYIVDVAIAEEVRRAFRSYGRVVYIDHHMLSVDLPGMEVVHVVGSSASELTYRHLGGRLPRLYSRVAPYGAIGDYLDHTEWVEEALETWDRRLVYFEAGVLMQGLERARKDHEFKRAVGDHLAGEPAAFGHGAPHEACRGAGQGQRGVGGLGGEKHLSTRRGGCGCQPPGRWGSPPTWLGG